jgi:hypothetical protein
MRGTERDGEIVDTSRQKERIFIQHQPTTPGYPINLIMVGCSPYDKV